jgi:hypothetical protein
MKCDCFEVLRFSFGFNHQERKIITFEKKKKKKQEKRKERSKIA